MAELVNDFLQKGSKVLVDGRLDYRRVEKDGVSREYYDVVGNNVQFLLRLKEKNKPEVVEAKEVKEEVETRRVQLSYRITRIKVWIR